MKKQSLLLSSLIMITALVGCTTHKIVFDKDYEVIKNIYSYKDFANNSAYDLDYCPTIGSPKLLVIPVWFTNSTSYISASSRENVRDDIRKAYIGTKEETGFHSVSSYYEAESFGKCHLQATISEWYECGRASTYYYDESEGVDLVIDLVKEAVNWYFENNPEDSKTNYDLDKNGQLDGVMLIYGSPDYSNITSIRDNVSAENMWAYCNWISEIDDADVDNPIPNVYFWASYDFMYSGKSGQASARTGKSDVGSGDTSHCSIDAHTYIHEMGHVFGLEDYYDYSNAGYCPAGAFSMQDYNVGGHDPYSLMAYNWVDPIVIHNECTIELKTFQETHELVLLSPSRTYSGSPFDEYMLVELFSPTGLNEFDCANQYQGTYPKGPSKLGIRLWHVDARLAYFKDDKVIVDETFIDPTSEEYKVYHAFSNTYVDREYGSIFGRFDSDYYYYNILQLIRSDSSANYKSKKRIKDTDLFYAGETFKQFDYSNQFIHGMCLNNMEHLNWSFTVNSIGEDSANITFTLLAQ